MAGITRRLAVLFLLSFPLWAGGQQVTPARQGGEQDNRFTSRWYGVYNYGQGVGQGSVRFEMVMIQNGTAVAGFIKEPNTFGTPGQPWLHAVFKGTIDQATGKLTYTKTYDGTAGQGHDVQYDGKVSEDKSKVEGTWAIGGPGGTFALEKIAATRPGQFAGVWLGTYRYPKEDGRKPVTFYMLAVHDGDGISGLIKEPQTFGVNPGPWLHAGMKGQIDRRAGQLTFTKTYDGTGGEIHDVVYTGLSSKEGTKFEGTWTLTTQNPMTGTFTLEKLQLDNKTLDKLTVSKIAK